MFGSTFSSHVCVLCFFFFFFFTRFGKTRLLFMYCSMNSNRKMLTFLSQTVHYVLFMDPQISLFRNFFIKNGSHGTIYTFKNYFATVISAINFQFQQNKSYPNRPLIPIILKNNYISSIIAMNGIPNSPTNKNLIRYIKN